MSRLFAGTVESLSVTCLSEVAWKDPARMRADVAGGGGLSADMYGIKWTEGNGAGVSALVRATDGHGVERLTLLDCGWDAEYMDGVFRREGVDVLLREGRIDRLVVTHEHLDHFWGVSAVTRHAPDIEIVVPQGLTAKGRELIERSGHTGALLELSPGPHEIFPGVVAVSFDLSIFLSTRGEVALYANVAGKGVVLMTGCGHAGVGPLLDGAKGIFLGDPPLHGLYGGLHISPFEEWGDAQEAMVGVVASANLAKLSCNHCTGVAAVRKMRERGLPVVGGTARFGSGSDLYLGNGDKVEF